MPLFVAHYAASTVSTTGCVKQISTVPSTESLFPPQINYQCDLCNTTHAFRLVRSLVVTTPNQIRRFNEYCITQQIEQDVVIETKKKAR